jgi:hypothetical protein
LLGFVLDYLLSKKNSMKKILLSVILLLAINFVKADSVVIGTGSFTTAANTYGPMRSNTTATTWNRDAYIYPASLLGTMANGASITSLAFYRSTGTNTMTVANQNFKIYIKTTFAADFGASNINWADTAATMTLVYNSDPSSVVTANGGFKTFPFIAPYTYNTATGTNLMILVEYTQTTALATTILWVYDSSAGVPAYTTNQHKYVGGTSGSPTNTTTTANERHPYITINYTPFTYSNDMGVTASLSPLNLAALTTGNSYNIYARTKNFGSTSQSGVNVYYKVDGGAAVGPVTTTGTMVQNDTQMVVFSGPFAYTALTGNHTIKIYTSLPSEENTVNDTTSIQVGGSPITSFPWTETFTPTIGWSATSGSLWGIVTVTTQANGAGGQAARANCYNVAAGDLDTLISPQLDLTSVTHPVLTFSLAYCGYSAAEDDALQVFVSSDGGTSWSAALYQKSALSSPSLQTIPFSTTQYNPQAKGDWRGQIIDLSAYAGQSNVKIGFCATSQFGNQICIDNIGVMNCNNYTSALVTTTGAQAPQFETTVNFTTIIPNGTLRTSRFTGVPPYLSTQFATNASATTQDGSIFTPDRISGDFWFTVDYDSIASYSISIDLATMGGVDNINKLYILKRNLANDSWVALSTTVSGTVLTATGLTSFSDFAIGGDNNNQLPVELSSFTSSVNGKNVVLNWSTSTEENNSGFNVERRANGTETWVNAGFVAGNGNSNTIKNYSFEDRNLSSGGYHYRLKQVDFNGNYKYYDLANEVTVGIPSKFALSQNYPNPFNPSTKINYEIPFDSKVSIKIFDITGREVASLVNNVQLAGYYTVDFNASALSSGVYFYQITADGGSQSFAKTLKMMLVK